MLARRAALVPAGIGIAALLAGVVSAQATSPVAEQTDTLFLIVLWVAIAMGVVVYGVLIVALIRYRARRSEGTQNPSVGNRRLETAWSVVPVILLVGITILSTQGLLFIERAPPNVLEINVFAQQWSWEFVYPDNTSDSELWIQRGVTFLFNVTSRDVIHSFYLPDFRVKIDAIPGVINTLWLQADVSGTYYTQCAEYCGFGHAQMIASVIVFDPEPGRKPYGPPTPPPPTPTVVDVYLEEANGTPWRILPSALNITLDEYVELRVRNNGSAAHTFTIDAPYNLSTGSIAPSSFRPLFMNATVPTTGTAYGGNASDRANGMVGTLIVVGGQVIELEIRETAGPYGIWSIFPSEVQVDVGTVVTFRVTNAPTNSLDHNFSVGAPFDVAHDALISPGETITLTTTLNVEASTDYICAIPGHEQAGMRGVLTVGTPPDGNGPQPVTYPFFGFGLTIALVVGAAGFGYVVHHAINARGRGGPKQRTGPRR